MKRGPRRQAATLDGPVRNTPEAWDLRAQREEPWEAAMWSERSQSRRFELVVEWLAGVVEPHEQLLDFGCGTGRLAEFLAGPFFPELELFGWDWSPAMRDRARQEHHELTVLDQEPAVVPFHHVVCVGTFNLSHDWGKLDTRAELARLWKLTTCTLTVSLYRGREQPGMLSYSHEDIVRLHERLGMPAMRLSNEHLANDWMVRFSRRPS